ncbi:uncharacterized protein AMSG_06915 [Thecamonas trahens ATCC 50062]|uniref:Uncharacterized protein n=1 Tax=Thecamonas trahens ATCC 50062 TaxID=461836 RepID=A0A0L0DDJ6_THETB|nr:hypothetical protein AMSG_06915 [Thecamonas trahens ATCC 50062]KNC50422.1 hypothetical protein AMSG_06915 [Thecamonas trahens ATCC 50062]|eukprot:XP_013756964.1 hypothetical protein AMSG_06915 [Thecamonas trahens ATCC 50062]
MEVEKGGQKVNDDHPGPGGAALIPHSTDIYAKVQEKPPSESDAATGTTREGFEGWPIEDLSNLITNLTLMGDVAAERKKYAERQIAALEAVEAAMAESNGTGEMYVAAHAARVANGYGVKSAAQHLEKLKLQIDGVTSSRKSVRTKRVSQAAQLEPMKRSLYDEDDPALAYLQNSRPGTGGKAPANADAAAASSENRPTAPVDKGLKIKLRVPRESGGKGGKGSKSGKGGKGGKGKGIKSGHGSEAGSKSRSKSSKSRRSQSKQAPLSWPRLDRLVERFQNGQYLTSEELLAADYTERGEYAFWHSVEPYFRDVTDADIELLAEHGIHPNDSAFIVPRLGRFYRDVWYEQDIEEHEGVSKSKRSRTSRSNTNRDLSYINTGEPSLATRVPPQPISQLADEALEFGLGLVTSQLAGAFVEGTEVEALPCRGAAAKAAFPKGPAFGSGAGVAAPTAIAVHPPGAGARGRGASGLPSPRASQLESMDIESDTAASRPGYVHSRSEAEALEDRITMELLSVGIIDQEPEADLPEDDEVCVELRAMQHQLSMCIQETNAKKRHLYKRMRLLSQEQRRIRIQRHAAKLVEVACEQFLAMPAADRPRAHNYLQVVLDTWRKAHSAVSQRNAPPPSPFAQASGTSSGRAWGTVTARELNARAMPTQASGGPTGIHAPPSHPAAAATPTSAAAHSNSQARSDRRHAAYAAAVAAAAARRVT